MPATEPTPDIDDQTFEAEARNFQKLFKGQAYWETLHNKIISEMPPDMPIYVEKMFDIADRLTSLMEEKGMDKKELARLTGKTKAQVSRWCAGHENLNLRTISKIEAALNAQLIVVLPKLA